MPRIYRSLRRLNSLWTGPVFTLGLMLVFFVIVPAAMAAPANPTGVTAAGCSFGAGWTDGLSRWIFGISIVLMCLAAVGGLTAVRSGNGGAGGGGEHVGAAIAGVSGVAIVLGMIGAVGLLAAIAISAAGGTACP